MGVCVAQFSTEASHCTSNSLYFVLAGELTFGDENGYLDTSKSGIYFDRPVPCLEHKEYLSITAVTLACDAGWDVAMAALGAESEQRHSGGNGGINYRDGGRSKTDSGKWGGRADGSF